MTAPYFINLNFGAAWSFIGLRPLAPTAIAGVTLAGLGDSGFPAALRNAIPYPPGLSSPNSQLPLGPVLTNTGTSAAIDGTTAPGAWIKPGAALFFAPNVPQRYQGDSIYESSDPMPTVAI